MNTIAINWPAIGERVEAAITKQRLSNLCAGLRDAAIGCESFARGVVDGADEVSCTGNARYAEVAPWRPGHALKGKL